MGDPESWKIDFGKGFRALDITGNKQVLAQVHLQHEAEIKKMNQIGRDDHLGNVSYVEALNKLSASKHDADHLLEMSQKAGFKGSKKNRVACAPHAKKGVETT